MAETIMATVTIMTMTKTPVDDSADTWFRFSLGNKNTRDDRVPCQYSPDDSKGMMMTELVVSMHQITARK